MVFGNPFGRNPHEEPARSLYRAAVAQARRPEFYADFGVPDTFDGRFELVALHVFLVLHRFRQDHPQAAGLAQGVFDAMFLDMDQSLRELGAGDLGVGRRVKRMAQGFYGRIAAYDEGLRGPGDVLNAALARNLYGTVDPDPACVEAIAAYMRRQVDVLAGQGLAALSAGALAFGRPPSPGRDAPILETGGSAPERSR